MLYKAYAGDEQQFHNLHQVLDRFFVFLSFGYEYDKCNGLEI